MTEESQGVPEDQAVAEVPPAADVAWRAKNDRLITGLFPSGIGRTRDRDGDQP
jgi:hypothetical protein